MNRCPICNGELQEGGLVIDGISAAWVSKEQFYKKILFTGVHTIGKTNFWLRQTKVPNAFFCENCDKVMGIFDVTSHD